MLCLTFDTDHMDEARMAEFLAQLDMPGRGTFFCTQKYDALDRLDHELAPHPFLPEGGDWRSELTKMRAAFPKARGWRAHSCVFSHLLAEWLGANGYHYASTNDQFGHAGIMPVRQPWGVWHMPIYYMDNMDFSRSRFWDDGAGDSAGESGSFSAKVIERALSKPGLYVFDFHPIHLMLNTPHFEFYAAARDPFKAGAPIDDLRHGGNGTARFFEDLCTAMRDRGRASMSLAEALDAHQRAS